VETVKKRKKGERKRGNGKKGQNKYGIYKSKIGENNDKKKLQWETKDTGMSREGNNSVPDPERKKKIWDPPILQNIVLTY
jgi:hypothetical protein